MFNKVKAGDTNQAFHFARPKKRPTKPISAFDDQPQKLKMYRLGVIKAISPGWCLDLLLCSQQGSDGGAVLNFRSLNIFAPFIKKNETAAITVHRVPNHGCCFIVDDTGKSHEAEIGNTFVPCDLLHDVDFSIVTFFSISKTIYSAKSFVLL